MVQGLYRAKTGLKQGVLAHILYWDTGLTEGWVREGWSGSSVKSVPQYRIGVVHTRLWAPVHNPCCTGVVPGAEQGLYA